METWTRQEQELARIIVRGAGRVVARLAVRGGARRSLDWLVDELFAAMLAELRREGVPNGVAAGMFAVSRRTWIRKTQAASEREARPGSTLWWRIRDVLSVRPLDRVGIEARFSSVEPRLLASVLNDMAGSGWIVETSSGWSARREPEEWTDARLEAWLLAQHMMFGASGVEPDAVAADTGLPRSRIEEALGRLNPVEVTVRSIDTEKRLALLGVLCDRVLQSTYEKLDDGASPARISLWSMRDGPEDPAPPRFRDAVTGAIASIRAEFLAANSGRIRAPHDPVYAVAVVETRSPPHAWSME